MLDELIRAALNEAAAECVIPSVVDERMLQLMVQRSEKPIGGVPNDQ